MFRIKYFLPVLTVVLKTTKRKRCLTKAHGSRPWYIRYRKKKKDIGTRVAPSYQRLAT